MMLTAFELNKHFDNLDSEHTLKNIDVDGKFLKVLQREGIKTFFGNEIKLFDRIYHFGEEIIYIDYNTRTEVQRTYRLNIIKRSEINRLLEFCKKEDSYLTFRHYKKKYGCYQGHLVLKINKDYRKESEKNNILYYNNILDIILCYFNRFI